MKLSAITESTTISVGLVLILVGGLSWLSTIYANELEHGRKITIIEQKIERKNEVDADFKREVIDRLARIEERVTQNAGK